MVNTNPSWWSEFVDDSVLDLMIFPILIFFPEEKMNKRRFKKWSWYIYIYDISWSTTMVISYNWRCPCSWPFFAGWFAAIPEGPGQLMVRGQDGQMWVSMNTKHGTNVLKTRSAKVCTWHKFIKQKNIQIHTHSTWNSNKWSLEYDFRLSVAILGCSGLF